MGSIRSDRVTSVLARPVRISQARAGQVGQIRQLCLVSSGVLVRSAQVRLVQIRSGQDSADRSVQIRSGQVAHVMSSRPGQVR